MDACRKLMIVLFFSVAVAALTGCRTNVREQPAVGAHALTPAPAPLPPGGETFSAPPPYTEDPRAIDWLPPAEPLSPPRERPLQVPEPAAPSRSGVPSSGPQLNEAHSFPADEPARNHSTRRDPVSEPVETQQKLVPGSARPPRLLDRLGLPLRSIWSAQAESAAGHPGGEIGVSPAAHAAPDFVSHRPTLRFLSDGGNTGPNAVPSWVAHTIAR